MEPLRDIRAELVAIRFGADGDECLVRIDGEPPETLRIRAIGLVHAEIDRRGEIEDVELHEGGPDIWSHELTGQVFVNGAFERSAVIGAVAARLGVRQDALAELDRQLAASAPPFSMRLGATVHDATVAALRTLGISHVEMFRPSPDAKLVALHLGGTVLIAQRFQIDRVG